MAGFLCTGMNTALEFWSNVRVLGEDECWEWKRARHEKGYGTVWWRGKFQKAHRVAFSLYYGVNFPLPLILHKCDNAACCNANHHWIGTITDNNRDMWNKGRGKIPDGRKFESLALPKHIISKLGKMPDHILASQAGVNKSTIRRNRIKRGIISYGDRTGDDGKYRIGNYPARWL